MKIDEISEKDSTVDILVKILSIDKRTVNTSRGETTYYYGLIGDDTGVIPYTAWEFPQVIKAGDAVEIKYARVKEYNGRLRIYIDSRTEVILKPGENIEVKNTYKEVKLQDISSKTPFVSVTGMVSGITEHEYQKSGGKFILYSGFIEDDTSKVRISSFGRPLENGKIYSIKGARVSEFNGQMEISVSDKTTLNEIQGYNINLERNYRIFEIKNPAGSINIMAFVITLGTKSGIIKRCSVCNKPLTTGVCPDHPDAKTILDIFTYFTVDDGTGHIQAIAGKNAILPVLGISEDEIVKVAGDIYNRLYEKLYGHAFKMNVDFVMNDNSLSLRVNKIQEIQNSDVRQDLIELEV
ncbi:MULTISPECIES: replication protein A [Acidiplasma]|jgi:replication factor A1|uniref:Replication protein A n=3 Tax=Acidiplasma TaxID=507753 RepID=A0A0N8VKW6_9ARCH|nr:MULTISPECIES: replication protein A [Acidiplasma]KJE49269.1 replication protein A [Acidiplasma sp. MBA-1]KPV46993.1 replication protein A [Acidiplasma aeolicum]KQB34868.1 replication protein A [Acidiplasma cupricumulans]KQB35683.1 replication protein A [Acidiplasma aeolicum]WMT54756.1 MAG: replication protein A [Acidiplasma sp.]